MPGSLLEALYVTESSQNSWARFCYPHFTDADGYFSLQWEREKGSPVAWSPLVTVYFGLPLPSPLLFGRQPCRETEVQSQELDSGFQVPQLPYFSRYSEVNQGLYRARQRRRPKHPVTITSWDLWE
jgi:hypothetical protein